jgi:hypothetical protein
MRWMPCVVRVADRRLHAGAFTTLGKGRVVVFAEAAAFTTQLVAGLSFLPMGMNAPGAGQNHRLLLNIIHWLDGA